MTPEESQSRAHRRRKAFEQLYKPKAPTLRFEQKWKLHEYAAEHLGAASSVTYLEFGVFGGQSIAKWASWLKSDASRLVGFDSFTGLPETWDVGHRNFEAGTFSTGGAFPDIKDPRVSFVKGWFQNTVPAFVREYRAGATDKLFIHFDADLYSSTLFLLTSAWHFLPDYYFIMDDFFEDDIIALHDFAAAYPVKLEWLADNAGNAGQPAKVFGRLSRTELVI